MSDSDQPQPSFLQGYLRLYWQPTMLSMLALGFASGLPLYMVFQKLSFWLRDSGIERSTIGFFYWVTFAYSFKFLWSPVVDRYRVPVLYRLLGQRRSWMIVAIAGTATGLVAISRADPTVSLSTVAFGALLLAFSGATLDISIDAWRIESASTEQQANMAAAYSLGYRGAYIFAGFGLAISEWSSWPVAFLVMAGAMITCAVLICFMKEPPRRTSETSEILTLQQRLTRPFVEPFRGLFVRLQFWIFPVLVFVAIYRLSDFTMGVMAAPLYSDLGFSRAVVGGIQSGPGVLATIGGLFLGGFFAYRLGLMRALLAGALVTLVTNGAYAWLAATATADESWKLMVAIIGDNIAGGYVTTVFTAYLSSLPDRDNVATQYALVSSLFSFFCKFVSGFSGVLADSVGYVGFFLITASYTIPAAALLLVLARYGPAVARGEQQLESADASA